MKLNTLTLIIVVAVVSFFPGFYSCKKTDSQPCDVSRGSGCLLAARSTLFYEYIHDMPSGKTSGRYDESFSYNGRQLIHYYPQTGAKDLPYTAYIYKDCSRLAETRTGNSYNNYAVNVAQYAYHDNGIISGITYLTWLSPTGMYSPAGHASYRYEPGFQSIHYFDSSALLTGYDSVMLYPSGKPKEKWEVRQTVAYQYRYKEAGSMSPDVSYVGDSWSYYTSNNLRLTETVDSVYYNAYGYDTLVYKSRRSVSGALLGISRTVKTYTSCE